MQQKPPLSSCLLSQVFSENCSISTLQDRVIRCENCWFISTILLLLKLNLVVCYSHNIPCWVSTEVCHLPTLCIFLYVSNDQNLWILLALNKYSVVIWSSRGDAKGIIILPNEKSRIKPVHLCSGRRRNMFTYDKNKLMKFLIFVEYFSKVILMWITNCL